MMETVRAGDRRERGRPGLPPRGRRRVRSSRMAIPPAVALDVPVELSTELSSSALRSCNLALGAGRCVSGDRAVAQELDVSWIATLRYPGEPEASVRIELRSVRSPESVVAVRQLDFQVTDAPAQRWATAGVVVA